MHPPGDRLSGLTVAGFPLVEYTGFRRPDWGEDQSMEATDNLLEGEPASNKKRGVTRTFAFAILAAGVLLGFALGLLLSGSLDRGPTSSGLFDEELVSALFDKGSPGVVEIVVTRRAAGVVVPGLGTGTGSGFFIDDAGHIVTSHHVVDGAEKIMVELYDGRSLEATKLGSSPAADLAVLQVDPEKVADIRPLPLADSDDVRAGQMAIAIGSPFRNFNSLSVGVVSGTGRGPISILRRPIPDMIQTDAALNPGNSGGPLLNSSGEVIGVNSSVRTASLRNASDYRIWFAVPSNTLKDLMPQLLERRQIRRPWLGISGGAVTVGLTESLGVPKGVYVAGVFPDSPAAEIGLVPFRSLSAEGLGDVITAVDGEPVASVEDIVSYFNTMKPGNRVRLSVFRDERVIEVEVALTEWPDT